MNDPSQALQLALLQWAQQAQEAGWIDDRELVRLQQVEQQQAEALFQGQSERPLIVAFFGGTGVGKSSLLNRLAGGQIARVGVQRPTSQEVTLYLHRSCRLADLPDELPLDETRIAYHDDDSRRLVAWLDLPDIDSVEARHRQLVQAWIPYVDWLVYVVSPERYQDDQGWRFVQQRGGRHAWLFIINQWDLGGADEQLEDFSRRLRDEGFKAPIILRTSCVPGAVDDDFPQLEQTIAQAIADYGLERLQQLGSQAREQELSGIGAAYADRLVGCRLSLLQDAWQAVTGQHLDAISNELALNRALLSRRSEMQATPWWRRRGGQVIDLEPEPLLDRLWGDRIDTRLQELSVDLENLLLQKEVPRQPFQHGLDGLRKEGRKRFRQAVESPIMQALAQPGGAFRRALRGLLGGLSWLLPLGAAGWAAYHLVQRFYLGTQGDQAFLGFDFAMHTVLLVGLAWFIPWLLQLKLEPDPAAIVGGALKTGCESGVHELDQMAMQVLKQSCSGLSELEADLTQLLAASSKADAQSLDRPPEAAWQRSVSSHETASDTG